MLRDDDSLALIDFGLAKDAALARQMTDHGLIFGTPHYMSPEQGHGEIIDARSDLYSLGVMLFEMLAKQKPYSAENPMAIIYKHKNAPLPSLPESLSVLQPLIDNLMAKKPEDRSGECAARGGGGDRPLGAQAERSRDRGMTAVETILLAPTPAAWVDHAVGHWRELLVDHANCEKKAASTALALMFAYPEDRKLCSALSRLAREELRHFEQVQRMMETLDVPHLRQKPGRYGAGLRTVMRTSEPGGSWI